MTPPSTLSQKAVSIFLRTRWCSLHWLSWRICSPNTIDLPMKQSIVETCHKKRLARTLYFQNTNWSLLLAFMLLLKVQKKHSLYAFPDLVWKDPVRTFLKETKIIVRTNFSTAVRTTGGFALEIHWCCSEHSCTLLQRLWLETSQARRSSESPHTSNHPSKTCPASYKGELQKGRLAPCRNMLRCRGEKDNITLYANRMLIKSLL